MNGKLLLDEARMRQVEAAEGDLWGYGDSGWPDVPLDPGDDDDDVHADQFAEDGGNSITELWT